MLLLGMFSDDISMYSVRNNKFNLLTLITTVLAPDTSNTKFKTLKSLLTGRMFSACTMIADMVNVHDKDTALFINKMVVGCIETVSAPMPISVKMSAIRCMIKLLRRLPAESLPEIDLI